MIINLDERGIASFQKKQNKEKLTDFCYNIEMEYMCLPRYFKVLKLNKLFQNLHLRP